MSGIQIPAYDPVQERGIPNAEVPTQAPLAAFGGGDVVEKQTKAAEGLGQEAIDISQQAQKMANKTAYIGLMARTADSQATIQAKVSQMRGANALGAPDVAEKEWKDNLDDILGDAPNGAVKYMVQRDATRRGIMLNRFVQTHVGKESEALDVQNTKGAIDNEVALAAQNSFDAGQVEDSDARIQALAGHLADVHGFVGEKGKDAREQLTRELVSPLHQSVIEAKLDAHNVQAARAYYDEHSDDMTEPARMHADKVINAREQYEQGDDFYRDVKQFQLPDGSPNLAKARAFLFQNSKQDTEGTEGLWRYVEGRLNEDNREKKEQDSATTRDMQNQVITGQKKGTTLADALTLAPPASKDPLDQQTKEEWIRQQYAVDEQKIKTDPQVYMGYWRAIHGEKLPDPLIEAKLNAGLRDHTLAGNDWKTLSEQLYERQMKGENAQSSLVWKQIDNFVDSNVGKDDREKYKTLLRHLEQEGQSPEQVLESAKKLMKDNPNTGWWGSEGPLHDAQYKADAGALQQATENVGQLHDYLGTDTVKAISRDMLRAGARRFTDADMDQMVQRFGGYDKFKPGSPLSNAIQSMKSHGVPLVPANIEWTLKKYPDGVVDGK